MPGVECGDIGPKLGYSSKDNGWLILKEVRIPQENMLSRFMYIDEDGCYSMNGDPRILFSTMLKTRITIFSSIYLAQMAVCAMAVRYSIVRRQFRNISGKNEETQLIDYQAQQMKLFPIAAQGLVFTGGTEYVINLYEQLQEDIKKNDFTLLDVLHHFSSGMKAVYTQAGHDGIISMR